MSASDDLVTIDFSQAPLAIKITALGTLVSGIAAILVGILLLFPNVQIENAPLIGIILAIIGIVMVIAGLGLYRLWKPAWILYIIVAVVLLLILIGTLGLDKLLIALLMIFISLILGDLLAENEYFLRPDQREGVSPASTTVRQKKTETKVTRPKTTKKVHPEPKPTAKSEEFVDDYLGEDTYRDEDTEEEYDMIDMIEDETYDEDEWERKE
ncbi:MAG: hypothetical protein ACFFC7_16800 [Candidatus Hermodarchaeota archaeon]